ncbi:hypothetical protein EJB05_29687, partial [Eragrostis curvula]
MGDSPAPPPPPSAPAKVYYDGCPGCAMERKKESRKGVPYKELVFVGVTTLASCTYSFTCYSICLHGLILLQLMLDLDILSSRPVVPALDYSSSEIKYSIILVISTYIVLNNAPIRDLHVAQREEDIGFYAGFLGASYMIGRGFASIFWGIVADRIGRKPVIAISIFSVIIFNTLFGLSVKYWMAITTRLLLGALNGILAPIKAYSIEVCRDEHQALGLSIVSTAWGLGVIIGPAIGGYLAQETLHKHKGLAGIVETTEGVNTQESKELPKESLFKNWPLMSSILTYSVFSLHDTAYSEIFSLWTVSDRKFGGLSFSSKDVGQVLTVAGLRLGAALYSASMIKSVLAITITTGISLLQNNAVPQEQRGAANGIATTAMSLFKAVAPAAAGVMRSNGVSATEFD